MSVPFRALRDVAVDHVVLREHPGVLVVVLVDLHSRHLGLTARPRNLVLEPVSHLDSREAAVDQLRGGGQDRIVRVGVRTRWRRVRVDRGRVVVVDVQEVRSERQLVPDLDVEPVSVPDRSRKAGDRLNVGQPARHGRGGSWCARVSERRKREGGAVVVARSEGLGQRSREGGDHAMDRADDQRGVFDCRL